MTTPTRQSALNTFEDDSSGTPEDTPPEHSQTSNDKTEYTVTDSNSNTHSTEQTDNTESTDSDPDPAPPEEERAVPAEAAAIAGKDETNDSVDVITPSGVPDRPEQTPESTDSPEVSVDVDAEEIAETWGEFFPHDTPYEQQIDAIERAIDVLEQGGYLAMEGACGTGKTIISLAASLYLTRRDDVELERTVVGTPVKQQLRQFIEEVRAVNRDIAESDADTTPARGVVLVGKRDLHPYLREEKLNTDSAVQDSLDDLRQRTVDMVKKNSTMNLEWPSHLQQTCADCGVEQVPKNYTYCEECEGDHPEADNGPSMDDGPWYDHVRAQAIVDTVKDATDEKECLHTDGMKTPFPSDPPTQNEVVDTKTTKVADVPFDPFYAGFLANKGSAPFSARDGTEYVLDADDLVANAAPNGVCPHESMTNIAKHADVCIGNYNHIFDPETRKLTVDKMDILTEETVVIIDEGHMLEERVRDMLSDELGLHTLKIAYNDFGSALNALSGNDPQRAKTAQSVLNQLDITQNELEDAREFFKWLGEYIDEEVTDYLEKEYGNWEQKMKSGRLPNYDMEIPLRNPKRPNTDRLTTHAHEEGYDGKLWASLGKLGGAVDMIHERADIDRETVSQEVGEILNRWYVEDHEHFFREIELTHAPKEQALDSERPWTEDYNAQVTLFNCIPSEKLADVFDQLGGGIVMSATLQPIDVYTEVSGLDRVAETGRPLETANYGLQFPVENRASWIVDADRFTGRNRGDATTSYDQMTGTRKQYERVLRDLGTSYGNILIGMPSYKEAEWAHEVLDSSANVSKEVHLDKSSGREFTDDLLEEFFDDEQHSILVTSTRGTVTEGVDYDGEKLHTCAVFGIPIVNIGSPRMKAVIQAYGATFGEDNDFEYALTVPAVRKARQAIGRVIRGGMEVGTRMLVDERYTEDAFRSVNQHLSPDEQSEFQTMTPDFVGPALSDFWNNVE